jgi:aminoglycoside phosphotransferase (APT) family kinase protein
MRQSTTVTNIEPLVGTTIERTAMDGATLDRIRSDLEGVLAERGHRAVTVAEVAPFGDGHSGFTYRLVVSLDDERAEGVLRLSPPGARIAGPADVGRQGRIMDAVGRAGLPAPPVIATDSAPRVDGRAYALLGLVEGDDWPVVRAEAGDGALARAAVQNLLRMRELPVEATGIGADAPRAPVDELDTWVALLPRCPDFLVGPAEKLAHRLRENAPEPGPPSLVHGDYHYGNMIFRRHGDGALAAVVDWEIASLGDPLADLGCLAVASLRRKYAHEPNPTGGLDVATGELIDLFGADPGRAMWFVAETCFKYAAILGYNFGLHRSGRRPDPIYDRLTDTMRGLVDDGERVLSAG